MTTRKAAKTGNEDGTFTDEERAAMRERAKEVKSAKRRGASDEDGEQEVLAKIAEMPEPDRSMATRIHTLIRATAPDLTVRTWYGMPAYAKEGKVICFFQNAQKFKARYSTLGFNDGARLDDGAMWPVAYALTDLTADDEARIAELVKRAVS